MSERSKGDVSRINNNANPSNSTRVVKNPLLSASVTGLSFDDFPNKPQLLPAAPPVVHAPPPAPAPVLIAGILNREPKSLVTVGQPSSIDDSEALDEINLNTSSEDSAGAAGSSPYHGASDPNANPLLEPPPGAGNDSLLSQAASSFTALPSVASNVFSSFSKRIYAAGSREQSEEPRLDIQPTYIQQANYAPVAPVPAPFYAAPPPAANEVVAAPEPPKLYAPTEIPAPNAGALTAPPPTVGNPNTYRFAAKKKLYAPIPGFSDPTGQPGQQQPHPTTQAALTLPFQTPPYPPQPTPAVAPPFDISAQPAPPPVEERKSGGGLFSLTSLVPTGVLQNISGLVQSATGRSSEPVSSYPSNPPPSTGGYFDISTVSEPAAPSTNFFGGPTPAAPQSGNYFVPGAASSQAPGEAAVAPPPAPAGGFFAPPGAASVPPQAIFNPAAPSPAVGGFFNPPGEQPAVAVPVAPVPLLNPAAPPASAGSFFNPGTPSVAAQAVPTLPVAATSAPNLPPAPTPEAGLFTPRGVLPTATPPPATGFLPSNPNPLPGAPPVAAVPPPAAGQASYRLQKGTRLYKSPLTAQETAASSGYAAPLAPTSAPAAIFNPLAAAAVAPAVFNPLGQQEVPLFVPSADQIAPQPALPSAFLASAAPPPTAAPPAQAAAPPAQAAAPPTVAASIVNPFLAAGTASVPLFAAPPTSAAIPFFIPTETKEEVPTALIQKESQVQEPITNPGIPFFAPASTGIPFFNPAEIATAPIVSGPPTGQGSNEGITLFAPPPPPASGNPLYQEKTTEEEKPPKQLENQEGSFFATKTVQEPTQSVSLFAVPPAEKASPPNNSLFAPQEVPLFAPEVIEPVVEPDQAPSAPVEVGEDTPLFVPVPAASEAVPLYPPPATATESNTSSSFFAPSPAVFPRSIPNSATLAEPFLSSAQEDSTTTTSLFTAPPVAIFTPTSNTPSAEAVDAAAASDLLGSPEAAATPNLFQSSSETQTVFSPFAQTVTTPQIQKAGQDLVPPPIGFVAPPTEVGALAQPPPAPSPLQNFFTPATGASADFNFFGSPAPSSLFPELPVQQGVVAPPALAQEPPVDHQDIAPAPLGFDQLLNPSQQATQQTALPSSNENSYPNSSVNSFAGFFGGPGAPEPAAVPALPADPHCGPVNFFDQVPQPQLQSSQQANEDQRIQNFFNNPPLQDQPAAPGELKYDIVHSGLAVKQLPERSQTPVSNLVEPPSSACSEFSTLAPAANISPDRHQSGEDLIQQHLGELPEEILREIRMANANSSSSSGDKGQVATPPVTITYSPVVAHWFYKRSVDTKFIWTPFSHYDSALLETSLNQDDSTIIVPVEGGRYDVNIKERTKTPVYWEGKAIEVRRCSWFYKGVDSKYVPYTEDTAAVLESEYKRSAETGEWHQKILLEGGEQVVFHGPTVIVHFLPQQNAESAWGGSTQGSMRPRVVKRDLEDFTIEQGESQRVDHLLFMVHGIGSACDLKMRSVEEVVDDFRVIAQQLVSSHYKNSTDMGLVGRVEVLPISWHGHLHSEELGIDEKLKSITLESIPRLRNFTNDTLLDVLFYTSPKYCQKIMNTVADALNDVYLKYRMRHPEFNGGVSLAGHSLGSLILFDLLCHQEPLKESEEENKENPDDQLPQKLNQKVLLPSSDLQQPKQVSYAMGGPAGTGQPVINYTQLIFHPKKFFALGSPIGMFVTIRGIDKLGLDFHLPTCPGFYNIFHPFDPVAYRIEALVNPDMNGIRPVLIPHHKGRKRMHLELRETMTRVGADIKQRFMDTFKTTLDSVNFLATVTKVKKEAEESLEKETSQTSSQAVHKHQEDQDESSVASSSCKLRNRTDSNSTTASDPEFIELDFPLGKLNDSKRVDYVLQEAPLEFINEYIFALSSHVCYWGSEDTILFVMKEIYASLGISTDSQVPQSSMTIERPSPHDSQSLLPM
ncbi:nascent polypeptide-associated complex subunit alpha, muscle-specific form isoform X2 [Drosophila kikkawai]|uniref:Nascent polypeptide-associated complex subunit alpha, muscle-specific form isoform X2 n=1 Tax=Drosophila kikkawai TaxID=30033 RepID=A0A6P4IK59_DROKI|nr:nascent polypeptide-associated complex subunit alpha, muscle-specific form [Drosophila kikkawai]